MRDVRVRDVVVHDVEEGPEAAVDCAQSTAQPVPLLVVIVRQRLVRVLQQRDHDLHRAVSSSRLGAFTAGTPTCNGHAVRCGMTHTVAVKEHGSQQSSLLMYHFPCSCACWLLKH